MSVMTNKAYLSTITVTDISQSFTYKMAAKKTTGTKLRHRHPMYIGPDLAGGGAAAQLQCESLDGRL